MASIHKSLDHLSLPNKYESLLNPKQTQVAIEKIKRFFETELSNALNLFKVECPLIMQPSTGMTETVDREAPRDPIQFNIDNGGLPISAEVTQAATKWKRWALKQFDCAIGEGILADMRAIRQDEVVDNYNSAYVDQWDWEKVINSQQRTLEFLRHIVDAIWCVIKATHNMITEHYPILKDGFPDIPEKIEFIHAEDLLDMYPSLSPDDRENELVKKHPAVFLCGVGYNLKNGLPHGTRTADYDDWITETRSEMGRICNGLNGDIIVWNPVTQKRHELSSMAIRVTKESLKQQLDYIGDLDILQTEYGRMIRNDMIPLSIGGGIGQSRMFMYLLRKAALGECTVSVWPENFRKVCKENNIHLLQ